MPITLFSKHNNAYYMTSFAKDTTLATLLSFPEGVPMPCGTEAIIENGIGKFGTAKWLHNECRVLIKQKKRSKVICRTDTAGDTMMADKRLCVEGLKEADVTFLIPKDCVVYAVCPAYGSGKHAPSKITQDGKAVFENVTGEIRIAWQKQETRNNYLENGIIIQ